MSQPHLILILQAPLAAYGDEAVDRIRPTDTIPGRSMITGLLGNALGYRRSDADALDRLQSRINHAARTELLTTPQTPLRATEATHHIVRDFHTAQLSKDDQAWTTYGTPETRSGSRDSYRAPEIREVHYLAEHRVVIAVTLSKEKSGPSLDDLAYAIQRPARPLFIGRKSCLPERPVFEAIVHAESETEALSTIHGVLEDATVAHVQWDGIQCHASVNKTHEQWVSDLKDWRNGVHVGRRLVNRGVQCLRPQAPDPTGETE